MRLAHIRIFPLYVQNQDAYSLTMHLVISSWSPALNLVAAEAISCFDIADLQPRNEAFCELLPEEFCSFSKTKS